jgi:hypothetical protein
VAWSEWSGHRHCGYSGKIPIVRQDDTNRKVSMYQFSATDFYLVMLSRWPRPMARPPRSRPNITKLLDKVAALPPRLPA